MGRLNDIGAQFEELTKRARGGRRLDGRAGDASVSRTSPSAPTTPTTPTTPSTPSAPPTTTSTGGSLKDKLRDILRGKVPARAPARSAPRQQPAPSPKPAGIPSEATVRVEYSPSLDGDPDPGEVVWVFVPFEEDPTQGKDRPLVVIGRRGNKLVGIPLTTKRHDNEAQLEVGTGDWDSQHRVSYARLWRMMDIEPDAMRREGAVLDAKRFELLVRAVDEHYDVDYPQPPARGRSTASTKPATDDY
jgi:hypothetical protein